MEAKKAITTVIITGKKPPVLTRDISSSGCINFEAKPEADSGFRMMGAPEMVALGDIDVETAAAEGNVGFTDTMPWAEAAVGLKSGPTGRELLVWV